MHDSNASLSEGEISIGSDKNPRKCIEYANKSHFPRVISLASMVEISTTADNSLEPLATSIIWYRLMFVKWVQNMKGIDNDGKIIRESLDFKTKREEPVLDNCG